MLYQVFFSCGLQSYMAGVYSTFNNLILADPGVREVQQTCGLG